MFKNKLKTLNFFFKKAFQCLELFYELFYDIIYIFCYDELCFDLMSFLVSVAKGS